jgi:hypothetical protein
MFASTWLHPQSVGISGGAKKIKSRAGPPICIEKIPAAMAGDLTLWQMRMTV